MNQSDENYRILSGNNLIESMRYGGYKSPAYAVAELIDNSIEAGAKNVELLCLSEREHETGRNAIKNIAVLDDGSGMDAETLRISLKFADGTRANTGGIGRFGMGLPASSFSQCRRVDIYTWIGSIKNTLHTYLDLDEINEGVDKVPKPKRKKIPNELEDAAKVLSKNSGTIVIWSKLDKCPWRTSKTIIKYSELLVGRIYRKFLCKDVSIRMAPFIRIGKNIVPDDGNTEYKERYVKPNDPLYLMSPSSTPGEWGKKPMFQKDGDLWQVKVPIKFNGKTHNVTARYSIVKPEVLTKQAGSAKYGKHAASNVGISIVRAGRELDMDTHLIDMFDTRERWWGTEIDFPPALDEFFGITNNKQGAINFSDVAKNINDILGNETGERLRINELKKDGDFIGASMADLIVKIYSRKDSMMNQIKVKREGTRTKKKRHDDKPDKAARGRKEKGHSGSSDISEGDPEEKRLKEIKKAFMEEGYDEDQAELEARDIIQYGRKFVWTNTTLSGSQFFDVTPKSGIIHIKLNVNHAAYKNLVEVLEDIPRDINVKMARERLYRARDGLRLLLASWGRHEDEATYERKKIIQDYRIGWGAVIDDFLKQNQE